MFRSDFKRHTTNNQTGFTLMEVAITIVVSAILGAIVNRFYRDSFRTFSQQEQVAERNQNAYYTVNKLVELIQQAGSGLPTTGWVCLTNVGGVLTLGTNPRGVEKFISTNPPSKKGVAVDDVTVLSNTSNPMLKTTHILVDYANPATPTAKFEIDTNYNDSSTTPKFIKGFKNNTVGMDSVKLLTPVDLSIGDMIYGYREDQYLRVGDTLVVRPNGNVATQMVLAENIDSLGFTFLTAAGVTTTTWSQMRSASILVRARTARPDPRLPPPGYHKISLPMNVMMRNKV
jgi:prepilin-type N-terminal cleavage/methylation domain-containing protein